MNISRRMPAIIVEYDGRHGRIQKRFENVYEGRRFFVAKSKERRNPRVVKIERTDKETNDE